MVSIEAEAAAPHYILGIEAVAPADLVATGDQLGFYRALDMLGSLTADKLAEYSGVEERLVHDWLHHEVVAGHLSYLPRSQRFVLTPEQARVVAGLGASVQARR